MRALLRVVLLFIWVIGCGDDGGDGPPDGDGFTCGDERCRVGIEACIVRSFAPATCEALVGEGLDGIERCRAHVDAYCDGSGERCDEGGGDANPLPEGAYRVLCL